MKRVAPTGCLLGVDEVGRGPLAGPVMVGAACVPIDFNWADLPGVTDSKKLTPEQREKIYAHAHTLRERGVIDYAVTSVSARQIDVRGIVPAITTALTRALRTLEQRQRYAPSTVVIRLDGGLTAPPQYQKQTTIIKGDLHEPVIGLASIVAKVTRDTYMTRLSKRADFIPYDFARHKGYGTTAHRAAILNYGLSSEHRATFCRSLLT